MRGWATIVLAAVSACRFGFTELTPAADADLPPDAAPPTPGMARVTVIGEEGESRAGQPIAGAYVMVIEATGATTTTQTSAQGIATVALQGASSIHIARPAPDLGATRWLVYSFTGLNGDLDLLVGGRAVQAATTLTMTASLPAFPAVEMTESRVRGPARCLDPGQAATTGTTASFGFSSACAGESVPLYAQGLATGDPWAWIALGDTTLVDSGAASSPGPWQMNEKYAVEYNGLPDSVKSVTGLIGLPGGPLGSASWGDAIVFDDDWSDVVTGSAQVVMDAPPLVPGSLVGSFFDDGNNATGRLTIERVDQTFGNRQFDLSLLGPALGVPTVESSGHVVWTSSGLAGADFVAMQTTLTTGGVDITWNAYGPASTTELRYPALPPALAMLAPSTGATWGVPAVQIGTLSAATYTSALPILDRDLLWWRDIGAYLPAGTLSLSMARQGTTARSARPPFMIDRAPRPADRR